MSLKQIGLSTEQFETMRAIMLIIKSKHVPVFSVSEIKKQFPYMKYHAIYMRLKRLTTKKLIEPIGRGVYVVTERGMDVINQLKKLYGIK